MTGSDAHHIVLLIACVGLIVAGKIMTRSFRTGTSQKRFAELTLQCQLGVLGSHQCVYTHVGGLSIYVPL